VAATIQAELAKLTRLVRQPVAEGYGVDLLCVTDVTPRIDTTEASGLDSLRQDAFHRITSDRGSIPGAPNDGINVRRFLNKGTTPRQLRTFEGQIAQELLKDDRYAAVEVTVSAPSPKELFIKILITPEDPNIKQFELLLAVKPTGAEMLEALRPVA